MKWRFLLLRKLLKSSLSYVIYLLLSKLGPISFNHIHREGNSTADIIFKQGLYRQEDLLPCFWFLALLLFSFWTICLPALFINDNFAFIQNQRNKKKRILHVIVVSWLFVARLNYCIYLLFEYLIFICWYLI